MKRTKEQIRASCICYSDVLCTDFCNVAQQQSGCNKTCKKPLYSVTHINEHSIVFIKNMISIFNFDDLLHSSMDFFLVRTTDQ